MNDFSADELLGGEEELSMPCPVERAMVGNWADIVRPLVERIAQLEEGKCLRLRRLVTSGVIAAVRNQMERRHGCKLITRSHGGATYFWKGPSIGGSDGDLRRREERLKKDKPHYNI